ncbi:MAG: hypothetical protein ACKOUR_20970 [Planctomycetota bacterium]
MLTRGHRPVGLRTTLTLAVLYLTLGSLFGSDAHVEGNELYDAQWRIVEARQRIRSADAEVSSTKRTSVRTREALQRQPVPEILAARQELDRCKQEFDGARADVMSRLEPMPEYRSAVESHATAKQQLTGALAIPATEDRSTIVSRYEQAGKLVRQLERDASADQRATQANVLYQEAQKNLRVMIQKRDQEIAANPEMRQAERAYVSAMAGLRGAKSDLQSEIRRYDKLVEEIQARKDKDKKK